MKKLLLAFLILLLTTFNVHGADTLKWSAYLNWSPWIYPIDNSYDGILIEELKQFEKDHGVKTEMQVIQNWKRCQKLLEVGKLDMILGANKTEAREKVFYYTDEPAFVNKSTISAYALKAKKSVTAVESIDGLKKYLFQMTRGNSFGNKIDAFINTIPKNRKEIVNKHEILLKKMLKKRGDYFFSADSSFESLIKKNKDKIPDLKVNLFHKIFRTKREVPVYIVFSKRGTFFKKYGPLWVKTIKKYYSKIKIEERIKYHKQRSKK
ncbi:MAG: transporter substrate-binding domain-containing protein [Desulfobacterales bacterium]|nr:transporter substrate-binding domain-containing protein [Desulfobacterales bacterium]MCP4160346.1 transporter substrate-binding domain-containing protein [Deltaproteobacteria bacterium]